MTLFLSLPMREFFQVFCEQGRRSIMISRQGAGYICTCLRGPIKVNGIRIPTLGSAMTTEETAIYVVCEQDADLLLVDVKK
jgi:hypothetical protein